VDDFIIVGSNIRVIDTFKDQMKDKFRMSDLGALSFYLGIEVKQGTKGLHCVSLLMLRELLKRLDLRAVTRVQHPWNQGSS
jgi:hypothetical protein